jgi:NAD-dependent dihydropyrimidine dehydrogenase PreA subunit
MAKSKNRKKHREHKKLFFLNFLSAHHIQQTQDHCLGDAFCSYMCPVTCFFPLALVDDVFQEHGFYWVLARIRSIEGSLRCIGQY